MRQAHGDRVYRVETHFWSLSLQNLDPRKEGGLKSPACPPEHDGPPPPIPRQLSTEVDMCCHQLFWKMQPRHTHGKPCSILCNKRQKSAKACVRKAAFGLVQKSMRMDVISSRQSYREGPHISAVRGYLRPGRLPSLR